MAIESIINQIVVAANASLSVAMRTALDANDETRAGVVKIGLLQDDPTRSVTGVSITTHLHDPDDDSGWRHAVVSGPGSTLGTNPPPYEIGGGEMWYRRYTTMLTQFFKSNVTATRSRELASIILSRAETAIKRMSLPQEQDDFGEVALQVLIHSSVNVQSGGPGAYIYHGKIWFQVLTEKEDD